MHVGRFRVRTFDVETKQSWTARQNETEAIISGCQQLKRSETYRSSKTQRIRDHNRRNRDGMINIKNILHDWGKKWH